MHNPNTVAMTAQNGTHSGGAVNAVTKSGTNAFRGDAFEFFRHHSMNATDPFATKKADGSRKDDGLKRNQYGVTLGGPIKTDSLFFFYGYQGTNTTVNPTDNRAFVPTAATMPAISCPGIAGYGTSPQSPREKWMSEWQMPQNLMSMRTSSGPSGRRSIRSGPMAAVGDVAPTALAVVV